MFVMTWNVLAMEAAACYIGECKDPARDAKIAMTAEGFYGFFIFVFTAVALLVVLGGAKNVDPLTIFTTFIDKVMGTSGGWVKWLIGIPLILALLLSILNAISGCARSLYQTSQDGLLPRWFGHLNRTGARPRHGVQRGGVDHRHAVRLTPADLHLLQHGLPGRDLRWPSSATSFTARCSPICIAPSSLPTPMKWLALAPRDLHRLPVGIRRLELAGGRGRLAGREPVLPRAGHHRRLPPAVLSGGGGRTRRRPRIRRYRRPHRPARSGRRDLVHHQEPAEVHAEPSSRQRGGMSMATPETAVDLIEAP